MTSIWGIIKVEEGEGSWWQRSIWTLMATAAATAVIVHLSWMRCRHRRSEGGWQQVDEPDSWEDVVVVSRGMCFRCSSVMPDDGTVADDGLLPPAFASEKSEIGEAEKLERFKVKLRGFMDVTRKKK